MLSATEADRRNRARKDGMSSENDTECEQTREALRDYHRRRMADTRDTRIIAERAGLVEQAKAAGLDLDTIAALAARQEA
jgi:hypothetical protein